MKKVEVGFGHEVRVSSAFGSLISDVYFSTGAMMMCMTADEADAVADALKEAATESRAKPPQKAVA
ncbi:MAG: hypothetical protein ABW154_14250 [Dyella sp.]